MTAGIRIADSSRLSSPRFLFLWLTPKGTVYLSSSSNPRLPDLIWKIFDKSVVAGSIGHSSPLHFPLCDPLPCSAAYNRRSSHVCRGRMYVSVCPSLILRSYDSVSAVDGAIEVHYFV